MSFLQPLKKVQELRQSNAVAHDHARHAVNRTDAPFPEAAAVSKYIDQDRGNKYDISFFSEPEIRRLQQQKSIEDMTAEDYATYTRRVKYTLL